MNRTEKSRITLRNIAKGCGSNLAKKLNLVADELQECVDEVLISATFHYSGAICIVTEVPDKYPRRLPIHHHKIFNSRGKYLGGSSGNYDYFAKEFMREFCDKGKLDYPE